MSRYTGPKGRINRRLGAVIFEGSGAMRAFDRRPQPPGMAAGQRKLSKYGEALREKQKIKFYYGLLERPLRRIFDLARRQPGNTGENLLILCERRLDSVIRLAGLTRTRPQARQAIGHGHFRLNGRATDIASLAVAAGDVVQVKPRPNLVSGYSHQLAQFDGQHADWLRVDAGELRIEVLRLPTIDEVTLPVDVGLVVELLSR
jgi:small subunit ribosomal protein S4